MSAESGRDDELIIGELDALIEELHEEGNLEAEVSVSGFAARIGISQQMLRDHGFPASVDQRMDSARWEKWQGLIVDIPRYVQERCENCKTRADSMDQWEPCEEHGVDDDA